MAHVIQFSMRCSDPDIFQIEINVSAVGHKWVYWAIDIVGARRDISPAIGRAATAQLVSLDVDRAPASLESQNQVENLATAHPTVIQLDSWDVSLIPSVDSLVFPYSSTILAVASWIYIYPLFHEENRGKKWKVRKSELCISLPPHPMHVEKIKVECKN